VEGREHLFALGLENLVVVLEARDRPAEFLLLSFERQLALLEPLNPFHQAAEQALAIFEPPGNSRAGIGAHRHLAPAAPRICGPGLPLGVMKGSPAAREVSLDMARRGVKKWDDARVRHPHRLLHLFDPFRVLRPKEAQSPLLGGKEDTADVADLLPLEANGVQTLTTSRRLRCNCSGVA